MNSGTSEESTDAAADPSGTFLDRLPSLLTLDLRKLGFDPHLERYPGLVSIAYHPESPVSEWDQLTAILEEDVQQPIRRWLTSDQAEPLVGLYRLIDRTEDGVFEDNAYSEYFGLDYAQLDRATTIRDALGYVLKQTRDGRTQVDVKSLSYEKALAAFQVLFVDALATYIETAAPVTISNYTIPDPSGIDGTRLTGEQLDDVSNAIDHSLWDNYLQTGGESRSWPAGMVGGLQFLVEGLFRSFHDESSEDTPAGGIIARGKALSIVRNLIEKHVVDYFVPVVGDPHHTLLAAELVDGRIDHSVAAHDTAAAAAVLLTMICVFLALATRARRLRLRAE